MTDAAAAKPDAAERLRQLAYGERGRLYYVLRMVSAAARREREPSRVGRRVDPPCWGAAWRAHRLVQVRAWNKVGDEREARGAGHIMRAHRAPGANATTYARQR